MTKKKLIQIVAKKANLTKKISREAINTFLAEITKGLAKGEKVVLSGFGTFKVIKVKPKKGRIIATGKEVNIPAHRSAKFVASKTLKRTVK